MEELKKAYYGQKTCVLEEGGAIIFDPDSQKEVVGAEKMTYDEYLDVQIASLGKQRGYFAMCYFNYPMEFRGEIEKCTAQKVCFKRIFVEGMFNDGEMFDGKEDHVWMDRGPFSNIKEGGCVSFFAEVYRYVKTGNGKQIDYGLRNPEGIKQIEKYDLPSDRALKRQAAASIACEVCYLNEQCNRTSCIFGKEKERLIREMTEIL